MLSLPWIYMQNMDYFNALLNMYLGSDGVPLILYIIFLERNIVCLVFFHILHL